MASGGSPFPPLLMIGGIAVAVAGIAYAQYVAGKKRTAAMREVARTMGFAYEDEPDFAGIAENARDLPLFNIGHSRTPRRLLRGKLADRETSILDYRYTTGSGKNAQVHNQTVVVFPGGGQGLPPFQLRPEGFLHGLAEVFGAQDIDFTENEEFSKRYLLKGPDESAIRKAFTIDVLSWFAGAPGWSVQAANGLLMVFRGGKLVEPAEIPAFAADALRIAGLFKGS